MWRGAHPLVLCGVRVHLDHYDRKGRGVHRVDDALLYVRMARVCRYIWYGINLCIYTSRVTLLRSLYIKGEQVESGRPQPLLRAGEQAGVY